MKDLLNEKKIQKQLQLLAQLKQDNELIDIQEQKFISDDLISLQNMNWLTKQKSVLKFLREVEIGESKVMIVVKFEETKQAIVKTLRDLQYNYLVVNSISCIINNAESVRNKEQNKKSTFYYVVDYNLQIMSNLIYLTHILFVEMDLFDSNYQKLQQIAIINEKSKIQCLFLMNSASLDDFLFCIYYQQMEFDQALDILNLKQAQFQVVSTQIKGLKKKQQNYQDQNQQKLSTIFLNKDSILNKTNKKLGEQKFNISTYNQDQMDEQPNKNLLSMFNNASKYSHHSEMSLKNELNSAMIQEKQITDNNQIYYLDELDYFNFQNSAQNSQLQNQSLHNNKNSKNIQYNNIIQPEILSSFDQIELFYTLNTFKPIQQQNLTKIQKLNQSSTQMEIEDQNCQQKQISTNDLSNKPIIIVESVFNLF